MGVESPNQVGYESSKGAAWARWEFARALLGGIYILGGLAHLLLAATSLELYESFADRAVLGAYTDLWVEMVVPNLAVLVPLVGLFELALGTVLLWRGRAVQLGHAGGAVFQAGLVLSGPWGPINAVLAGVHALAARRPYPRTVRSNLRAWRRG